MDTVLDPLQVDDQIIVMGEVQVGFVSLVADLIRQMLEKMAHAVTLRQIIVEMWLPLLHPIGEISNRLEWALVAIYVARPGHLRRDPNLELANKKSAKCAKCNLLSGFVAYLSLPLIL